MTLWCKKKSLPTQMDLCNPYMVLHTIPQGNYKVPRSTNKINFLTKFLVLEKFVDLMKDLKYECQSIFALWGRVKLNFRDRQEKPIFFLRTPATVKFFTKLSKNNIGAHHGGHHRGCLTTPMMPPCYFLTIW